MLWSKQYYHYDVERWLTTSDGITPVNDGKKRAKPRMDTFKEPGYHRYARQMGISLVCCMGSCFSLHFAGNGGSEFAKHQLLLIMREWYMKPDGQLPAYEWNFSDVNPPVQAWAALEVYRIEKETNWHRGY